MGEQRRKSFVGFLALLVTRWIFPDRAPLELGDGHGRAVRAVARRRDAVGRRARVRVLAGGLGHLEDTAALADDASVARRLADAAVRRVRARAPDGAVHAALAVAGEEALLAA